MAWFPPLDLTQFFVFTLVLVRTSAVVMTVPVLGAHAGFPSQVRVFLSMALAFALVTPSQLGGQLSMPSTLLGLVIAAQAARHCWAQFWGLGVMIILSGVQLAGQIISQMGGMSLAEVLNPDLDTDVPLLSQVLNMFALAIFVTIGGHRMVLGGLLDTFAAMPARLSARRWRRFPRPWLRWSLRASNWVSGLLRRAPWPCCWPTWYWGSSLARCPN